MELYKLGYSVLQISEKIKCNRSVITKVLRAHGIKSRGNSKSSVRRLAEQIYKNSIDDCKCVVCGYDKHIEVAHIKAVADFDDGATIAEINDINNLIGLCPNHHWEFDNGLLDITPYINRRMEE